MPQTDSRTRDVIKNVRRIEIRTRRIVEQLTGGAYHSVFKGRGIEFDEVREYAPGDDVRAIDWNVTARFGHPYIKKFVEERELTVMLVVDISGSGDFGGGGRSRNEFAAEIGALLAFSAIRNNDRVGLMLVTEDTELYLPPRKGRRHVLRLIRELLAFERKQRGTDLRKALETVMRVLPRRAVVFLISDMLDTDYSQALNVAARRHDVIALRPLDRRELRLPDAGILNFEDIESGHVCSFNSGSKRMRRRFTLESGGLRLQAENWCRRAGVDLVDLYNGEDVVTPLMQLFRMREKRR